MGVPFPGTDVDAARVGTCCDEMFCFFFSPPCRSSTKPTTDSLPAADLQQTALRLKDRTDTQSPELDGAVNI